MSKPGELRADLERRITEELADRFDPDFNHPPLPVFTNAAKAIVDLTMDMACNTTDAAIKVAAPDLIPASGGLYQELLTFVLTMHAIKTGAGRPDLHDVYRRSVWALRQAGWSGGEEFDLWST